MEVASNECPSRYERFFAKMQIRNLSPFATLVRSPRVSAASNWSSPKRFRPKPQLPDNSTVRYTCWTKTHCSVFVCTLFLRTRDLSCPNAFRRRRRRLCKVSLSVLGGVCMGCPPTRNWLAAKKTLKLQVHSRATTTWVVARARIAIELVWVELSWAKP